jgi:hypothetical protein
VAVLVTVVVLLTAATGSARAQVVSAGAVATIAGSPLSDESFGHWFDIAAASEPRTTCAPGFVMHQCAGAPDPPPGEDVG